LELGLKPVVFNQDGPGFACKQAVALGYPVCFNSGVILWKKSSISRLILESWWNSSKVPNKDIRSLSKFPMNWKYKWPWEQATQHEIFLKYINNIQVLSFPTLKFLPWSSKKNPKSQYPTDAIEPWCFTHWPGAECFITHFCASANQKQKMRKQYDVIRAKIVIKPLFIDDYAIEYS
jgi:hypothetical protein